MGNVYCVVLKRGVALSEHMGQGQVGKGGGLTAKAIVIRRSLVMQLDAFFLGDLARVFVALTFCGLVWD